MHFRNLHSLETDELSEEFRYFMNRVRDAVTTVAKTKAEEKGINGIGIGFIEITYIFK